MGRLLGLPELPGGLADREYKLAKIVFGRRGRPDIQIPCSALLREGHEARLALSRFPPIGERRGEPGIARHRQQRVIRHHPVRHGVGRIAARLVRRDIVGDDDSDFADPYACDPIVYRLGYGKPSMKEYGVVYSDGAGNMAAQVASYRARIVPAPENLRVALRGCVSVHRGEAVVCVVERRPEPIRELRSRPQREPVAACCCRPYAGADDDSGLLGYGKLIAFDDRPPDGDVLGLPLSPLPRRRDYGHV